MGIKRHAVAQIELALVNIGAVGFIVDLNTIAGGIDRAVVGVGGTLLCHTDTLLHRLTVLVGKVRKPAVKYITRTGRDRQLRDRGAILLRNVGVIKESVHRAHGLRVVCLQVKYDKVRLFEHRRDLYRVGAAGEIGVGKRQGLLYYLIAGPAGLINGAVVFPAVERLIRTGQRLGYNVAQLYRGGAVLAEHNDFAHGDVCLARAVIRSEEYHKAEVIE